MYTVASAAEALDRIAPLKTQMDWDNSGLLVGDPSREITKILVALDATLSVIQKAEALGADAVVNIRYGSSSVMQGAAEIIVYGTAVKFL